MAAFSTTAVRLFLALLVAAGVSGAIFLAVHASKNDSKAGVIGQLTETVTAVYSETPSLATATQPGATGTPAATSELATLPPPLPTGTPDTTVASRVPPTLDQIHVDKTGKYYVDARDDGCSWHEFRRAPDPSGVERVLLRTDCSANFQFIYKPSTGEVILNES